MSYTVKILDITTVTHDVKCFRIQKPSGYHFTPGQATDVAVNKTGWENEKRPFTFTCLQDKEYLEFTIKRYADHQGVTNLLHQLQTGDELIIDDAWGAIQYKGEGYFIAGGAGITPFIAILRQLHQENRLQGNTLIFSNKTAADIIYEQELSDMLGKEAVFILTKENKKGYRNEYIDENFIKNNVTAFDKHFYVCGPDIMVQSVISILEKFGADTDTVVFEK